MPHHTVVEYVHKGQTYEQPYRNGDCVGLPRPVRRNCVKNSHQAAARVSEIERKTDGHTTRLGECENTGHFVSGSRMHTTDNTPAGDLFQRIGVKILAHGTSCLR